MIASMEKETTSLDSMDVQYKSKEYWMSKSLNKVKRINLLHDHIKKNNYEKKQYSIILDKALSQKLFSMSNNQDILTYTILISALKVKLHKYTSEKNITIGVPPYNNNKNNIINNEVLPLITNLREEMTFKDLILHVHKSLIECYENQYFPLENILKFLKINDSIMDLVPISILMKNFHDANYIVNSHRNDISLCIERKNTNEIIIEIIYNSLLFTEDIIKSMSKHYCNILTDGLNNPNKKIKEIEMLSKEEKKILYDFNNANVEYPNDKTIHELFKKQVEKMPDNIAIVFEDEELTYKELDEKSNQIAMVLREKGVDKETIVGIMLERSIDMIVGMLGILKAGGAYLPIVPDYPINRVKYILEDSGINLILIQERQISKIEHLDYKGEFINFQKIMYEQVTDNKKVPSLSNSNNLSYVLYTSGSTGKPKGVLIEHRNVIGLVAGTNFIDLNPSDNLLMTGSFMFDITTFEIWASLLNGLTLFLIDDQVLLDPFQLENFIKKYNINILHLIPQLFNQVVACNISVFETLKYFLIGGDLVRPKYVNKIQEKFKKLKILHMYGPTENTTFSTFMPVEAMYQNTIPIGRPVNNSSIHILNELGELQPVGVPGEIYAGGSGVARGYLNRPELTKEKFVHHPFIADEKIYRTGDLGRWLPDGNIEFLGRIDNQIKIRGYRIEIGEIESVLLKHDDIKEAIVTAKEDNEKNKYLCAYIVLEKNLTITELRTYISKELPDYMIPTYFVQLDKIPLTHNGKVDRKLLTEQNGHMYAAVKYEAPRNEIEIKLVEIWQKVLHTKQKIGINDNFFELGGHSLKALEVVNMIEEKFNARISIKNVFENSTISELYEVIKNSSDSPYADIKKIFTQEYYELSYSQKRLWIINQLEPDSTAYNLAGHISLFERVNKRIIEKVFKKLIDRHESLRTRFKVVNGKPVQVIDSKVDFKLSVSDLSNLDEEELEMRREEVLIKETTRIFDLKLGPVFNVRLVKLKADKYDIIFSMHHIISDGLSIEILKREFNLLYNAYKEGNKCELQPLNIQYKDFASWQNELVVDNNKMKDAKEFWYKHLSEEFSILDLPVNFSYKQLKNRKSAGYRLIISENIMKKLKDLAVKSNTSLFIVLLTGFYLLLTDLTGQEDIIIGTASSGREHEKLKNIIGYFVNTVILRNRIGIDETFSDLLKRVNNNTLKALEYQNYPLELITEELKINYPKIQVFFNMINIGQSNKEKMSKLKSYHIEKVQDVKFDMVCYIREYINGIEINCNYLKGLFKPSRIEYIMSEYTMLLKKICEKDDDRLMNYLTYDE